MIFKHALEKGADMKDTFSKEYRIVAEKDENALFAANFLKV